MVNRLKKQIALSLVLVMVFFSLIQGTVFGATESTKDPVKDKPFPSQEKFSLFSTAQNNGNFGNDHVQALVGSDGRFNAGVKQSGSEDNFYNIIYSWPSDPWSSFATIKIDGEDLIYGNYPDGEFTQSPVNDENNTKNESVWKAKDISVRQVLQPAINPATGQPDALQIKYIITNSGTGNHDVGLRLMLDTMVDGNDSAPFKVPGKNGIESVDYERDYLDGDVPDFWQVFNDFENPNISAQYSMNGRDATPPDRFTIASWGSINNTAWDYTISPNSRTGDSAVGMWWNPVTLQPGEQKVITTYYGKPGVGGDQALVLSGKQKLNYEEWSSVGVNLISYFTNITEETLNDVRLVVELDEGLTLPENNTEKTFSSVAIRSTVEHTWNVKPTKAGKHSLKVSAYVGNSDVPIATADYEIEALAPIVPTNVSLEGNAGTSPDGTPITGRMSPLTINAAFDSPRAVGVTLIATDDNGDRYEAQMESSNNIDWTHTFTPNQVGLWEAPMTIKVIPRYADGTTGEAQEFPIVLIDPSGYIYHSEKGEEWKLPGATVVLQYFDPQAETWVEMTDEAYPGMLSPVTNPQVTGEDGRYAWDVAEGTYRVKVSRPGFETTISREVVVPPPVLDLHVGLTPTDRVQPVINENGVVDGKTYGAPVTIEFTSTDDEAGIRYITYKIDNGTEIKVNGNQANLPVINALGEHKVILTSVDHAGNETVKEVNFKIEDQEDMMTLVTQAIEKSKTAQVSIKAALEKMNTNSSVTLINEELNKALTANDEAKFKITRLKELLAVYNSPKIPATQLSALRNYVLISEQQNVTAHNKLVAAINEATLASKKSKTSDALRANGYSVNYLEFVKSNFKAYGIK